MKAVAEFPGNFPQPHPPNSRQSISHRRTGRRPRRPTVLRNDFPIIISFPPTHKPPVRAGHLAGPPNEFRCRPIKRLRLRRVFPTRAGFEPAPTAVLEDYSVIFAKSFIRTCRGRLSRRPAVLRNSLRISRFPVQRFRRGCRPRRPVPVNIRAVNQRWTGRPGGRPLRKRKNELLRNSMVTRAAKRGGPYKH